tara:strand:- start:3020 stop:3625 length:606 start_codon:yes stop_codon:yes gene_type:complete
MGDQTASKQKRDANRAAVSSQLMENIMTGGEISKKREKELQEAANRGRGIQFVEGSPTVKGLTQKDGKPVFRTGATAADYTGRIISSAPTVSELVGDASRALVGGKADDSAIRNVKLTNRPGDKTPTNFAKFMPEPKESKGIIPSIMEKGGIAGAITSSILTGKKRDKKPPTISQIYNEGVSNFADFNRFQLGGKNPKLGD